MESLRVRDLMSEKLVTIRADQSLATAHDLMGEYHIRHLLVVEDQEGGEELVGILTHRDLAMRALYVTESRPYSEAQDFLMRRKVEEVMTYNPETIDPDTKASDAAEEMLSNKFGCLPVVEGSQLVGILTEADFIKYFLSQQQETSLGNREASLQT